MSNKLWQYFLSIIFEHIPVISIILWLPYSYMV